MWTESESFAAELQTRKEISNGVEAGYLKVKLRERERERKQLFKITVEQHSLCF